MNEGKECNEISEEEIRSLLKKVEKYKKIDNITGEKLKTDIQVLHLYLKCLNKLFFKIWVKKETPEKWSRGMLIKIPKIGDLSKCSNRRGIKLLLVLAIY